MTPLADYASCYRMEAFPAGMLADSSEEGKPLAEADKREVEQVDTRHTTWRNQITSRVK